VVRGLTRRDLVCKGSGNDRVDERDERDARGFATFRIDLGPGDDVSHVSGHFDDERGTIIAGAGDDTILLS
jgi:hypothetical protein